MSTITIVDNNDLMLEIWTSDPAILQAIRAQNLFTKVHVLNDNLWIVRCEFASLNPIRAQLAAADYKILVVRFTSGSRYFSSDATDSSNGQNITG